MYLKCPVILNSPRYSLIFVFYLFIYLFNLKGKKTETFHMLAHSPSGCCSQSHPCECQKSSYTRPSFFVFLGGLSESWIRIRATGTQPGTPIGDTGIAALALIPFLGVIPCCFEVSSCRVWKMIVALGPILSQQLTLLALLSCGHDTGQALHM